MFTLFDVASICYFDRCAGRCTMLIVVSLHHFDRCADRCTMLIAVELTCYFAHSADYSYNDGSLGHLVAACIVVTVLS